MKLDATTLRPGGDPRTFNDFAQLKDELNKRFHPARPDVDWNKAHSLCLALFNQNGADLQTVAWFTLIRQHQQGIEGLNEGLSLLHILLNRHWQTLWPLQTHARVDILSALSRQLITGLRGRPPVYPDLSALYHAESTVAKIGQLLQTLELKRLTQIERLQELLTLQARTLESADSPESGLVPLTPLDIPKTSPSSFQARTAAPAISIKANATLSPNTASTKLPPIAKQSFRKGMGMGFALGIALAGSACAALFYVYLPFKMQNELTYLLPQLPEFTPDITSSLEKQLQFNTAAKNHASIEKLNIIDDYLTELGSLSPIWAQQYGLNMVNFLNKQYGEHADIQEFNRKWQHNMQANASSQEKLNQWAEGMTLLNNLSVRLDKLDEKPRSYITGSELKTIIFNARQRFNQGLPLEEELRRLEEQPSSQTIPESEYQRIDNHFKQLLNRYALLKQKKEGI